MSLVDMIVQDTLERNATDGADALIELYYRNYTDATELDASFIAALLVVTQDCQIAQEDFDEAIRDAEKRINERGGIVGSDGKPHKVRTPSAYEDIEEEEANG